VLSAAHNDRSLGLLVELDTRGPLSVHELLDAYDLCESDLHGLLGEFRAAGLIEEAEVTGRRGYDATETTSEALAHLVP
jgi:DNA-binding IclR family transcriptional regulator